MDVQDILNCSHGSWGPHFREVAFRSHTIALPAEFLSYLVADGVKVPETNKAVEPWTWLVQWLRCQMLIHDTAAVQLPRRAEADPFADEEELQDWSGSGSSSSAEDGSPEFEQACTLGRDAAPV